MLDFAFLDILTGDKRGLLSRKFFLDTVAPLFYRPRVKKIVNLNPLAINGYQVLMPLGKGNWSALNGDTRGRLWRESGQLAEEFGLPVLAVNRALRFDPVQQAISVPVTWGNYFILALALVLAEEVINHYGADKLFLVGDFPGLPGLISLLGDKGVPIVVQSFHPGRYEHIAHHMLYDQGVAMSVGYFHPGSWSPGDAVLLFDASYHRFILGKKGSLLIGLTDDSRNHAPELEQSLARQKVDGSLKNLAPILEAHLVTARRPPGHYPQKKVALDWTPAFASTPSPGAGRFTHPAFSDLRAAGSSPGDQEGGLDPADLAVSDTPYSTSRIVSYRLVADKILAVRQEGERLNLWGFFLDKDFRALYNTIQGIEVAK